MNNHKFEPQCKTREDLQCEFARVLVMCATAKTDAIGFWRIGRITFSGTFDDWQINPELVEWPIAIVEEEPVFRGDVLYEDDGRQLIVMGLGRGIYDGQLNLKSNPDYGAHTSLMPERLSWNPPQRTIEINRVKVKAPDEIIAKEDFGYEYPHEITIRFAKEHDAEAFKAAMEGE